MTNDKRRKLITAIGTGGIVYSALPSKWSRPVVDSVLLPTHAQATGPFVIRCSVEPDGQNCESDGIGFNVSGTILGPDVSGQQVAVSYFNELSVPPPPNATVNFSTTIQAGNVFSDTFVAVPPAGETWDDPQGTVTVSFGGASCSQQFDCED